MKKNKRLMSHLQRYLLTGVLTVIPIWVTWLVFEFLVRMLSSISLPGVRSLSNIMQHYTPSLATWLLEPRFQTVLAVILTLVALYILGVATTRVIGRRMINLFDYFMNRIPFVQTIYGSVKKLISALQQKPDSVQRVVLVEFPSPNMKTVGFVTRVLYDNHTGQELAAVYIPTTPNPTSGYLEIIPLDQLISTNWTMDEAMTFIISGGAVAPEKIHYSRSAESVVSSAS